MTDLNDRMREINTELAEKTSQAHEVWRARTTNAQELGIDGRKALDNELTSIERSITTLEDERRLVERAMKYANLLEPEPVKYVSPLRSGSQKVVVETPAVEEPVGDAPAAEPEPVKPRAQRTPARRGRPRKTAATT